MRQALRSGTASINGARIYYEVFGERRPGEDPVVLLHAGIADSRMWDDQLEALTSRYQVIRYDHRGWGRSDTPTGPVSFHDDLAMLLQTLGVTRAHVLGISMGGTMALDFALTHPQMVSSLLLIGSWLSGFPTEASPQEEQIWQTFEAALHDHDLDRANLLEVDLKLAGIYRTGEQVDQGVRERLLRIHRPAFDRLAERELMRPWLKPEPPAAGRLGEIAVPTLVAYGDLDVPTVAQIAAKLGDEIASAQAVVMRGTAHVPNMEQPMEFNRIVMEFLACIGEQDSQGGREDAL